jgi:biopolymer transport protein ExbD
MTPLVDIMLVLLIIFIVTARLTQTPPNAIPLDLPKSATGSDAKLVLAITLGKNGETIFNGDRLPNDDDLLPKVQAFHTQNPDAAAVIQADGKVLHERVIHVLDLLSQAGLTQIAFGVSKTSAEPAQ